MPEFEPKSRNEYLLNEIRKNTEGGSGLPDVTDADDGKVLCVEGGTWTKTPGVYRVQAIQTSHEGGTWSSDYTFQQLTAAFLAGKTVQVAVIGIGPCNVQWIDSTGDLAAVTYVIGGLGGVIAFLNSDGNWSVVPLQ